LPKAAPEQPWYETIVMPALLRWARSAYGETMRRSLAAVGCDDIPANGMFVIGGLAMGAGDAPLGALSKQLSVSKQAVGQLVDTLVLRGYLKREVDESDRRKFSVALTERGWHAANVQREARERIDVALLARVGADSVSEARKVLAAMVEVGRKEEKPDAS